VESETRDPELWKVAKNRAGFKWHLVTYIIINGFFWILWLITDEHQGGGLPWPVWPMLGWGIGLAFNYFHAYHGGEDYLAKKEYEKLKRESEGKR